VKETSDVRAIQFKSGSVQVEDESMVFDELIRVVDLLVFGMFVVDLNAEVVDLDAGGVDLDAEVVGLDAGVADLDMGVVEDGPVVVVLLSPALSALNNAVAIKLLNESFSGGRSGQALADMVVTVVSVAMMEQPDIFVVAQIVVEHVVEVVEDFVMMEQ